MKKWAQFIIFGDKSLDANDKAIEQGVKQRFLEGYIELCDIGER
jgi:hypothetical protein